MLPPQQASRLRSQSPPLPEVFPPRQHLLILLKLLLLLLLLLRLKTTEAQRLPANKL